MIRVGLTGGIGSGKSTIAGYFEALGVGVYHADQEARQLMETHGELRKGLIALLGRKAFDTKGLNRQYIASRVFVDEALLKQLNALVHPVVRSDFEAWSLEQEGPYVIQEAAILFENDAHRSFDRMILVTAPKEERIRRVMARDGVSRESVLQRMQHQWDDGRKIPLADYVIENTDRAAARQQVLEIHRDLCSLSGTQGDSLC